MNNRTIRFIALAPLFIMGIAALVFLFGWVVMLLWNTVLVPVVGVKIISFWQALGILILSRILVGGFGGSGRYRHRNWNWREKCKNMTPEEKAKFKEELKQRWSGRFDDEQANAESQQ